MNFGGMDYGSVGSNVGKCSVCKADVPRGQDMKIEGKLILHKTCFKCFCCEEPLQIGHSSRVQPLEYHFGMKWYCRNHMLMDPGKLLEELEKKGKKKLRT